MRCDSTELPDVLYKQIRGIAEEANREADQSRYPEAFRLFWRAFDLLPEPKQSWTAASWLLASIGDMLFHVGKHREAFDAFSDAVRCAGGLGNVFIHLRLGQTSLELGDRTRAADELMRAYMGGGSDAFEEQDAKYLEFLRREVEDRGGTL